MDTFQTVIAAITVALVFVAILVYLIAHAPLIEDPQPDAQEAPAPATGCTATPPTTYPSTTGSALRPSSLLRAANPVRITKCTDPQMWYAGKIGHEFTPEGVYYDPQRDRHFYWTREDAGHRNTVLVQDTEVIA